MRLRSRRRSRAPATARTRWLRARSRLWRARTEATLARAVDASGDHDRAAKLFTSARAWYATAPLHRELAELDAWRAANP
jgi:hypothetical protein